MLKVADGNGGTRISGTKAASAAGLLMILAQQAGFDLPDQLLGSVDAIDGLLLLGLWYLRRAIK